MSNLPLEVITEILVRLPVKNLLRCRCVSKLWCLTISGSEFTKLYINHSLQTSSNLSIIVNNFHLCTIGDVDNMLFHKPIELNHPLMCYNHSIKVLGCCDGLFCISNVVDDVVLWNPCIRKHHVLPFLPLEINRYYGACLCRVYVFGFGYDCVSDDYKVVRIAQFTGIGRVSFESEVKVYSLRKNLWRRIGDMPYCLNYPAANGVFANGALHWVVSENPDSSVGNIIVALDLGVEDYRVVPKPEEVKNSFKIEVGVLRGSLCLLAYFKPEHVDVWVMNESWTKLLSVTSREVIGGIAHSFKPLVYSKSGYEVLMEHDNRMFWYDLRKKEVKNLRIRNMPLEYEAEVCFDSLISPYPGQPYNGRTRNEHGETSNVKKKDDFLSEGFKLVL